MIVAVNTSPAKKALAPGVTVTTKPDLGALLVKLRLVELSRESVRDRKSSSRRSYESALGRCHAVEMMKDTRLLEFFANSQLKPT